MSFFIELLFALSLLMAASLVSLSLIFKTTANIHQHAREIELFHLVENYSAGALAFSSFKHHILQIYPNATVNLLRNNPKVVCLEWHASGVDRHQVVYAL